MRSLSLLTLSVFFLAACGNDASSPDAESTSERAVADAQPTACEEGDLVIVEERLGDGAEATRDNVVSVNYAGRLEEGEEFDSGQNVQMNLNEMIPGFQEGIAGMRVGGERQLTIPPMMGYGPGGRPPIPPCATLEFDVELLSIVQ